MSVFIKDLDELSYISTNKSNLTQHLKKNYIENIHYIIENKPILNKKGRGGHNIIKFWLREDAYNLLKNSYKLRMRYITDVCDNIKQINLGMCIENQTIGFIENSFKDVFKCTRQYEFKNYKVDLFIHDFKLVIECDEFNHIDRDLNYEKKREEYILSLGNKIIRFNPNETNFDLSNVLRDIHKIIYNK